MTYRGLKISGGCTRILFAWCMPFLTACSTTMTVLSSPPGADVFIGENLIGKTPITLEESKLESAKKADGYLLRVEKPGYRRVWLWSPQGLRGVELQVNLQTFKLDDTADSKLAKSMSRPELYRLSARMLNLQQQLLTSRDYDADQIEALRSAQPGSGGAQFLYALSLLRQDKTDEAKQALTLALELSPQEPDLLGLLQSLDRESQESEAP
jgi:hypothetical protein